MQGKSKGNPGPSRIFKKGKLSSDPENRRSDLVTKRNDPWLSRQMIILVFDSATNVKRNLLLIRNP